MNYAHLANAKHVIKRIDQPLHVIVPVFNPLRYVTRYNLFNEFVKHATDSGAEVWTIEVAFGNRPFEVTNASNSHHIQLRTSDEIWHKETAINAAVAKLPSDAQYISWVDADITFLNPDWVHETIQQLQHYSIVQMFTNAYDADSSGNLTKGFESFAASHLYGRPPLTTKQYPGYAGYTGYAGTSYGSKDGLWHPGYAWAYRKSAWNTIGGLLDFNIVGGGDHQMALGLIGRAEISIPENSNPHYHNMVMAWQDHALDLNQNIGVVPGTIVHHFHGSKKNRGYYDRWKILTGNDFDPVVDIRRDHQLLFQLTGNKPKLRDELRTYFRSRLEDDISE